MARELMALPDVPLEIEHWCAFDGTEMIAEMTTHDPEGAAIIRQKLKQKTFPSYVSEVWRKWK